MVLARYVQLLIAAAIQWELFTSSKVVILQSHPTTQANHNQSS
jgi:hypothetical protein